MAKTDFIQSTEVVENLNKAYERHSEILKEILYLVKELKELGFSISIKAD